MEMKAYVIQVRGKVQGVYYRQSTRDKAIELGLKGLVRNESDGSVYIEVEGNPETLEALVTWCHRGPLLAKVLEVVVTEKAIHGFDDFSIGR